MDCGEKKYGISVIRCTAKPVKDFETMNQKNQNLVGAYVGSVFQLEKMLWDITEAEALQRPIPGKWSTVELVAHLADFEPLFADRMKRVIAGDAASLVPGDEGKFAATLHYQTRSLVRDLEIIRSIRLQMARILTNMDENCWEKIGHHMVKGPLTLEEILNGINYHIPHHLPFLVDKRRALGLPEIYPGQG